MPKKAGETMTRVSFTMAEWDKNMLEELAEYYGVSSSDMVRRLVLMAHTRLESEREQEKPKKDG